MNQRVLVTGASRGIGRAIAEELARSGFSLVVHCRQRREEAESVCRGIEARGAKASVLQFDVRDREEARQLLEADVATHGPFYGAVCNAGITADAMFPGLDGRAWDAVIDVSLGGFYNVLQPIMLPLIRTRSGGRIVTISSIAGVIGNKGQVNYSAAKAGLIGATKALAKELASRQITVNCVAPGLIETEMTADLPREELVKHIPAGRFGTAQEVASLVAYLFSEQAGYITGQVISVNGGMI